MKRKRSSGNRVPAWLLIAALITAASGAGVGTVLAGNVGGQLGLTVSQSLLIGAVAFPDTATNWATPGGSIFLDANARSTLIWRHHKPDRSFAVVSDDKTAFQAAAEISQGDIYVVQVCLSNMGREGLFAQLELDIPDGLAAEAFGSDEEKSDTVTSNVTNVTRVAAATWRFKLLGGARSVSTGWKDCLGIQITSEDTNPPGFYSLNARVKQIGS